MSTWQSYVDQYLMVPLPSGGMLQSAAIVGLDGGLWAQSADFPAASTDQLLAIASAFNQEQPDISAGGIRLGADTKYLVVFYDTGKILRGKQGNGGIAIKKATSCLVIGIYAEKNQVGDTNKIIEDMADYLEGQGY